MFAESPTTETPSTEEKLSSEEHSSESGMTQPVVEENMQNIQPETHVKKKSPFHTKAGDKRVDAAQQSVP